jgi:hypothetical protein
MLRHELNNILEIGDIPNRKKVVQFAGLALVRRKHIATAFRWVFQHGSPFGRASLVLEAVLPAQAQVRRLFSLLA